MAADDTDSAAPNAPAPDIVSLGESLVDFLPDRRGVPLRDVESFRKVVGGAPTNLAVGTARLGARTALVGLVGADEFGEFIVRTLEDAGVLTEGIGRTDEARTGLTFVTLEEDGERSFLFYRSPSADALLGPEHVDLELIRRATLFQFGSNLMTEPNLRAATLQALEATGDQTLVSFDPNIRHHLWPSHDAAREACFEVLDRVDVVKVNRQELEFLAPDHSVESAWREVFEPAGVSALAVTDGAKGATLVTANATTATDAPDVDVVDTTGAGDGFLSGFLTGIVRTLSDDERSTPAAAIRSWPAAKWQPILAVACHVGSTVCETLGATPGLPTRDAIPDRLTEVLT